MEKKPNTPALRFRGSSGEWRKERFDNLVTRISTAEDTPALPRVEYEDIISGQGRLNKNINQKKSLKIGIKFEKGDILYGKLRPYLQNWLYPAFDGIAVGDFWVLRAKNADGKFIYYLIQSDAFQNFTNQTTGTKMPRADWNVVSAAEFVVPHDLLEQKHIGDLAQRLDEKIFLSEEKFKKLRQFRQAMLTKLFPAEGASEPVLRFRGFSGPWKTARLGDLGTTYGGLNGKTKKDFGHGAGRFVTYLNIFNNPIADLQGIEAVELDKTQNQVKYGDIFFTTSSETPEEVGMSSVWLGNEENVYLNSFCFGYRLLNNLYPFFMAYLLRSTSVRKKFIFLAQGISRYNISKNRVMDMYIPLPPIEEQKKIGDFLYSLDNFLSLQKEKLDKMRLLKAALLDKLFV